MDDSNYTLLCIDDEQNILNSLKRLLRKEKYRLLTGNSGQEGLRILEENKVHVVVSDQRMPEMNGTEFMKAVKARYPDILRIMLTGYTEVDSISDAINEGHIYKFFLKPWNDQNLKLEIRQAMEQYTLKQDNKRLHDQILQQNEELRVINENLEVIIKERTQSLEFQNQALQISHAILDDLPTPIIGVSSEMMVVMTNKASNRCWGDGLPMELGIRVDEKLGPDLNQQLSACLTSGEKCYLPGTEIKGRVYDIEVTPLTGRNRGQGIIITLNGGEV